MDKEKPKNRHNLQNKNLQIVQNDARCKKVGAKVQKNMLTFHKKVL
jgi:hypothetical protein